MMKKLKICLLLLGVSVLCCGAAACAELNEIEQLEQEGYVVTVSYDSNGGAFMGRDGIMIVDMFDPSQYEEDEDGNVNIKLVDPTDQDRPSGSDSPITLTRTGYFLAGWYKTRTIVTDESGAPVDESGAPLEETEDGTYVLAGTQTVGYPAYTYADPWDFTQDVLTVSASGTYSLTLYAGWVPYFEFRYFYEEDGEWVQYGVTDFDYKTTNAAGSDSADRDTIWIPRWDDGAMNYQHNYADNSRFRFPEREGYTFDAAYTDEACTRQIEDSFEHVGTVDYDTGTAEGRVQNIYVKFVEGTRYRIENAGQLAAHGDADGWYEILADLDFGIGEAAWPAALSNNSFTGRFYSTEGQHYTIRNVTVTHNSRNAQYGGLFGQVAEGAVIRDVSFAKVTLDIVNAGQRLRDLMFGVFAGNICAGAQIENVTLSEAAMQIGAITPGSGPMFNLVANTDVGADRSGLIVEGDVGLTVYGTDLRNGEYNFTVRFVEDEQGNPVQPDITVDADGNIEITFTTTVRTNAASYVINYQKQEADNV